MKIKTSEATPLQLIKEHAEVTYTPHTSDDKKRLYKIEFFVH